MTVLPWDLPDGIEVHRLPNSWPGGRCVYSVRERGEWWTAKDGRRRSWSSAASMRQALAAELGGRDGSPTRQSAPTRTEIVAWVKSAPDGATLGDGAQVFGLTVDQFLALRDGRAD